MSTNNVKPMLPAIPPAVEGQVVLQPTAIGISLTPKGYLSSLVPTSRMESFYLAKALGEYDVHLSEHDVTEINAVHLVIRQINRVNRETGEVEDSTRVAIIDDAGKVFGIESLVVLDCLSNLVASFGSPPWSPPLPILIRRQKGNEGRKYYTAEANPLAFAPAGKAVKK